MRRTIIDSHTTTKREELGVIHMNCDSDSEISAQIFEFTNLLKKKKKIFLQSGAKNREEK